MKAKLAAVHLAPGRLEHYRDFYRPSDTPPAGAAPLWLVWGNCQAEALRQILATGSPDLPYRTARVPPVHELQDSDMPFLNAILSQTAVLLTQPVRTGYRDLQIGVNDLRDRLPRGTTVLRWPVIRYAGLYPFQAIARLPSNRAITPPAVPYHDLRTVAAARLRRSPDDEWDVEVSAEQIRAVAAANREELAHRERRDADVAISDVLDTYGAAAAHTINHPGNPVLHDLATRLLAATGTSFTLPPISEPLLDSCYAPLEQRVIDALDLHTTPRPRWRHAGVDLDTHTVHATQLAWYRRHPEFVDVTVRRHRTTMKLLGLVDGAA